MQTNEKEGGESVILHKLKPSQRGISITGSLILLCWQAGQSPAPVRSSMDYKFFGPFKGTQA